MKAGLCCIIENRLVLLFLYIFLSEKIIAGVTAGVVKG